MRCASSLSRCGFRIPLMIERRWGRIINISGVSPYVSGPAAKTMVKLGIVGFTRGLAHEFAQHNITANCIGPGAIARTDLDPGETDKSLHSTKPGSRKGKAEEPVSLMLYLASRHAGFINGQCYLVIGGVYFQ